jgi:hypothetical protein
MTQKEATQILAILKAAYPNSYKNMTKDEAIGTVNVWAVQFAEMPAKVVMIAVQKLISTNTFPPAIGEVKEKIRGLYYEVWMPLQQHYQAKKYGVGKILPEERVKQLEALLELLEPMRTQYSIEPSLTSLLDQYEGQYLGNGNMQIEG